MKRNWFARHPIGFMALYFLLYLSAFNFLETQISMPVSCWCTAGWTI